MSGGLVEPPGPTPAVMGGVVVPPENPPAAAQPPEQPGEPGVVGRVTGPGGAAVSGATVTPSSRGDPGPPIPMTAAITDGDGRYWWSLPTGSWEITVSAPGFRTSSRAVFVADGSALRLDFELESA